MQPRKPVLVSGEVDLDLSNLKLTCDDCGKPLQVTGHFWSGERPTKDDVWIRLTIKTKHHCQNGKSRKARGRR